MAAGLVVTEKNLEEKQKLLIRETAGKYGFETAFYSSVEEADEAGAFGEAEILYGGGLAPYLAKAPHLKWVCSSWAGVTPYCREGVMREDQLLTNASGAYGVTIAEYGVMTALMLMRGQISYNTIMTTHGWIPPMPQATLKDARVTCLGTGDIGRSFAKRVRGFEPRFNASSSVDANVPISMGIPGLAIGGGGSQGNAHSKNEWYAPTDDKAEGTFKLFLLLCGLCGVEGVSEPMLPIRNPK